MAKKTTAKKKTPSKKTPASKTKKKATAAKKTASKKKPTAKKAASKKKPAAKKTAASPKKTVAKKTAASPKKPVAKKTAAKKTAPTKTTVKEKKPTGFANLTTWERVPTSDASEEFDIMVGTNDSLELGDMFGDEPEHMFIHRGSVSASGPVKLSGWDVSNDEPPTVYVIDGDLEIDGPLVVSQSDILTTLWVTGNVKVKRLACAGSGMLIVGGSLTVDDILVTALDDAGHLVMHGALHVPVWLDLAHGGRGNVDMSEMPATRFLSDHYAETERRNATEPTYMRADLAAEAVSPLLAIASTDVIPALMAGTQILK